MKAMKARRRKIVVAAGVAAGLIVPAATPAGAQDIRVEVTGSNIKRVEAESALPVQTITREEITRSGVQTAAELLDRIAVNSSTLNYPLAQAFADSARIGFAGASLRGLGYQRTLILLDGRRLANYAHDGTAVDLGAIPLSAIERIEVLKDGASAIYGSDAIGGVINFILRNDFRGAEASAYYGDSQDGGGGEQTYSATIGWGDLAKDKFNAFATASYFHQDAMFGRERPWTASSYYPDEGVDITSGRTFPANVNIPGVGNRNPAFPNCSPSIVDVFFPDQCRFDPNPFLGVIPKTDRYNVIAKGTWEFAPQQRLFGQATYTHNEYNFVLQPAPISLGTLFPSTGPGAPGFFLPASSPYYPHAFAQQFGIDGQPLNVQWRPFDLGLRDSTTTSEQLRFVGGVKGTIKNWDYEAAYSYNESKDVDHLNTGYSSQAALLPLISSGRVNPFATNTPDIIDELHQTWLNADARNSKATVNAFDGKVSGDVWQLPAGPLSMALGGEFRKEKLDQNSAPILSTGDIVGYGTANPSTNGDRNAYAFFAEFNAPIVKTLEGNAAVRYDHYSDFGSTTNPKLSLRWQPTRSVLLRTAWGTGFRAPSLPELLTPQVTTNTQAGLSDPLRCPVTHDAVNDCTTQFVSIQGGNPDLKPEKSEQWTLGMVFEPIEGLSIALDAFKINVTGLVNILNAATILGDLNQYGQYVTRGPVDPNFPNLPGPISSIVTTNANLGATRMKGVDVDARYRLPKAEIGQFRLALNGTYYHSYNVQQLDGTWVGFVGTSSGTIGTINRWKHYATVDWERGPWGATLAQTYGSGYTDAFTNLDNEPRRVGAYELYDLQARYTGFKNTTLTVGAKNIFDRAPPFTNQTFTFQIGYDPSYADPRGRFWYGSISYAFK